MSVFKIVNNPEEVVLSTEWKDAIKFKNKDKVIDEEGRLVGSDYQGHRYVLIAKKERYFSKLERFQRVILGVVLVMVSFFVALFHKSTKKPVRDLFTKRKHAIRFAKPIQIPQALPEQPPL